jgi:hypothetical protein
MTIFITSVSLLGLPAITGIWGNSKIQVNEQKEPAVVETSETEQPKFDPEDPCKNCPYNKKETV